jgi:putative tryptophan/tyrosine transport system substrate-binding protein
MVEAPLQKSRRGMVWGRRDGYQGRGAVALVVFLLCSGLCIGGTALAQHSRPFQIGALTTSWGPTPSIAGLRDGLVALGYREDVQFVMGVRFTQGDLAALPTAARELVQAGADVLIADSDNAAKAAQMATTRIPIVFMYVADPVGLGLIESFAQPGGNITGVTNLELELGPKRLEVFQQLVPGLKRVLFPYAAHHTSAAAAARVNREAARRLGLELVERPVHTEAEIQTLLAQMRKGEVDGLLVALHSHAWNLLGVITETASQQGIPTMFADTFMVERGGLASYGPDSYRTGRQAARLVDKILKGGKPAAIPVEMNSDIELTINLKAAKALGLTIPPAALYRAERLIR